MKSRVRRLLCGALLIALMFAWTAILLITLDQHSRELGIRAAERDVVEFVVREERKIARGLRKEERPITHRDDDDDDDETRREEAAAAVETRRPIAEARREVPDRAAVEAATAREAAREMETRREEAAAAVETRRPIAEARREVPDRAAVGAATAREATRATILEVAKRSRGHSNEKSKTLIFIATHMSELHNTSLQNCWPEALTRSPTLLGSSDVLFFTTTAPTQDIVSLFGPNRVRVELYTNPGYQEGAILALTTAVRKGWFNGYDWVVRLNPDVIIRDETWLVQTMQDPGVDGIFADCYSRPCTSHCTGNIVHTDFFVVRPRALRNVDEYYNHNDKIAESSFKSYMQPTLVAGKDRWLPHTAQKGACRVQGAQSPVIHDHEFIERCKAP